MYILSQVFVGIADLLFVASMFSKNKKWLVLFLAISDAFFATHYFLLDGGITGAITIFIDLAYLIIVFVLEHYKKDKAVLPVTIIAMVGTIVACIFTWQGAISLLPLFSMLIYLLGMIFKKTFIVKGGTCLRNLLNIVYMLLLASWVGAGLEFCLMISAIVGMIIDYRKKSPAENKVEASFLKKEETSNEQTKD